MPILILSFIFPSAKTTEIKSGPNRNTYLGDIIPFHWVAINNKKPFRFYIFIVQPTRSTNSGNRWNLWWMEETDIVATKEAPEMKLKSADAWELACCSSPASGYSYVKLELSVKYLLYRRTAFAFDWVRSVSVALMKEYEKISKGFAILHSVFELISSTFSVLYSLHGHVLQLSSPVGVHKVGCNMNRWNASSRRVFIQETHTRMTELIKNQLLCVIERPFLVASG